MPDNQNEVYRFRSVEALLGVHNELPRQTIYLALAQQMNDPSEDTKHVLYGGDDIALSNLLDCFIKSIAESFIYDYFSSIRGAGASTLRLPDGFGYTRVTSIVDRLPPGVLPNLIDSLMKTSAESRRKALVNLLKMAHPPDSWDMEIALRHISTAIIDHMLNDLYSRKESADPDRARLFLRSPDFLKTAPVEFIRMMESLVYRYWVAACFTKDFKNPLLWALYADSHRGACLIFNKAQLVKGVKAIPYYDYGTVRNTQVNVEWGDVSYGENKMDVNFFDELLYITKASYNSLMDKGDISSKRKIGPGSSSDETLEVLLKHHAKTKQHILFKHKQWEQEQEVRLYNFFPSVLPSDRTPDVDSPEARTIQYPIEALKGIIFGCRMSDADKTAIREAIASKYRSHPFSHSFAFYEAYSSSTGDMLARPTMTGWERS